MTMTTASDGPRSATRLDAEELDSHDDSRHSSADADVTDHAAPPRTVRSNDGGGGGGGGDGSRQAKKVYAVSVRWERERAEAERRRRGGSPSGVPNGGRAKCHEPSMEIFNSLFCCCARRVGSMFFLLERRDGSPIVVAGPCWPFCSFVTTPLIVILSGMVGYFIVSDPNTKLPWWFALIYYPIVGLVILALFCTSCKDPGLMERVTDEEAAENGWFWNEQVGSYRPAGAMYCRECKALVHDYDHVCPWTGTAIGKGNMLQFKVFVFGVNVLCYLSVGLVIWQIMDQLT